MGFFKSLFGGASESPEEKKKEEESKNFDVLKYDGVRALNQGQAAYAVRCFQHALELRDDLETRDYLSLALVRTGDLLPAYEQLQKLAEAQPDNQQILMRMAEVAYMMEDYGALSAACEKALLIDGENPVVHYLYARGCAGQGDDVNAIAMLTKAITLNADYAEAYLMRGETLLRMGDVAGADEDTQWLIDHLTENEDVLLLKARVEEAKGNADEALLIYNKGIELNPCNVAAFRVRGALSLAQGDKQGAEDDMRTVLELNPHEADGVNGQYTAEGTEDIAQKVQQAYRNNNPFGLG